MGLITKEVEVVLGPSNIKHFEYLGYSIPRYRNRDNILMVKRGTKIMVKVEDLSKGSHVLVNVKCDCPTCKNPFLKPMPWKNYLKCVHENGKYYCLYCKQKESIEKTIRIKLKNSKSFEEWCIENNRKDVLNRWDYELNNYNPDEILYATNKKYYFKCPRKLHKSELKQISSFTSGREGSIECKKCNSFAQYNIDNLYKDFLKKYWDYKKNTVNPWEINKGTDNIKVWIKCQEKDYHNSYYITPYSFIRGARCRYCCSLNGIVHPLDSLGKLLEDIDLLYLWSNKNKKSPYEYAPNSTQEVYWKCSERKHRDFKRNINRSNNVNFHCPECNYSKGEEVISNYFINRNFIRISQEEFAQVIDINKCNNYYIPQMKFAGLIGTGGGSLFYDFYLPKLNLLIEYDGEFHYKPIKKYKNEYIKYAEERLNKQQKHDKRKNKYAINNNIKLLRIPYWEFDNIENILDNYLSNIF